MSLACLLFLTMLLNVTHYDYAQVLPEGLLSWSFRIGKMLSAGWNAIRFSNETFIQFSHCSVFMTSVRYSKMQKSGEKRTIVCVLSIDTTDIVGLLVVLVVDCVGVNSDCQKVSGFLHFRKVGINFEELCKAECKGPKQSLSPLKIEHKYC